METNANNQKKNPEPPIQKNIPEVTADAGEGGKRSWLGRVSNAFSDAIQTSRGEGRREDEQPPVEPVRQRPPVESVKQRPVAPPVQEPPRRQPDPVPAPASAPTPIGRKMVVPEGVTIGGPIKASNVETEIAGRIEGDIVVEGRLFLGPTAVVTGNVRAISCRIEGLVEGKMECTQDIELARTGRLNSDAAAGKVITVAGQVLGTIQTPALRLVATGRVEGDVQTRQLHIEEGATFNGRCTMKMPAQRNQG